MSKKMMIFYSFPFNFLWKSLMTLMTMTLMTGREKISHSYFFTLNNVIMCFFYFFICTFA